MSKCQYDQDQDQGGRADLVTPPTDFCSTSVSLELWTLDMFYHGSAIRINLIYNQFKIMPKILSVF